ncbi:MAG TPA: cysteine--tRNA ligase [Candidatus Paceibacterota bacterium]
MPLNIYNSLHKQIEEFTPINDREITMYHCGPTVYDRVHIGNLRSFFLADTLRRYFEFTGHKVKQVMNITDIGHISGDADFGEDKMMRLLKRKGLEINLKNMLSAAAEETEQFEKDLEALNILHPHVLPKASDHIKEQIAMIQQLIAKEISYVTKHAIYFDVSKDPHYGALGGLTTSGQEENSRIEESEKRNIQDFALWKFDEMGFDSELGKGFPGWHIECSAMSIKYLGEEFDIHTGGIDLKPIHHNNEIAQACCSTDKNFAHYWMHGEFLNIDSEKMAKSLGNMFTLADLEEKNISPLALRVLFLQAHYRSVLNFSWDALEASSNLLSGLYKTIAKCIYDDLRQKSSLDAVQILVEDYKTSDILSGYQNDLNTPQSFSQFMRYIGEEPAINYDSRYKTILMLKFDDLFGLKFKEVDSTTKKFLTQEKTVALIYERNKARLNKDYQKSDELRDELLAENIACEDGKDESFYFPAKILGVSLQ